MYACQRLPDGADRERRSRQINKETKTGRTLARRVLRQRDHERRRTLTISNSEEHDQRIAFGNLVFAGFNVGKHVKPKARPNVVLYRFLAFVVSFLFLFFGFWFLNSSRENSQRVARKGTRTRKEHRERERRILLPSSNRFLREFLFSTVCSRQPFFASHFVSRPCRMTDRIVGVFRLAQATVLSDRQQRRNSDRTEMSIEHRLLRRMNFWKCQLLQ